MVDIEYICEEYFEGRVKPKHLRSFMETTPKGNIIQGYISVKPNKYLGSCLITTVNNEETNQFIQSMPKIHYFNDSRDISKNYVSYCYEKLDGTCLIIYPLKNKNGEIIEIVPKTRGRAVADQHFIELYNKVDRKPIENYYQNNDGILIFEMYGILNQHDIIHYTTGIDIRLIAVYDDEGFTNNVGVIGMNTGSYFKLPDLLFRLYYNNINNEWVIESRSYKFVNYFGRDRWVYPTNVDAVDGLKELLENLNKEYVAYNGINAVEGVVINTVNEEGYSKWLKCKPSSIENKHRSYNGIPRSSITKEVLKYFDEYGASVKEIYLKDNSHHTEYLHRMLSEEYNEEIIMKSKKKIERIFMQIWEAKQVPESIHNICEDLIVENPDTDVKDLMRIFSEKYPMKKKDASTVYNTLCIKLKQIENQ